jgi:CheY-like chemotaxis protein
MPSGKMNRVLIVDDDEDLGDQLAQMLAGLGYVAVSCDDPTQALNLFEDAPERFDIIIVDEAMPRTTGRELAALLLRIRDDVPMILLHGPGGRPHPDGRFPEGFRAAIRKPVSKEEIKAALAMIVAEMITRGKGVA